MGEWPNGNYVPVFLNEIPVLFEEGLLRLDVVIVQFLLLAGMAIVRWEPLWMQRSVR